MIERRYYEVIEYLHSLGGSGLFNVETQMHLLSYWNNFIAQKLHSHIFTGHWLAMWLLCSSLV
jgi:hypothetical protein